ncbi:MAG: hypothetical protein AAFV80_23135, partial [Bacteroidota bacterium]
GAGNHQKLGTLSLAQLIHLDQLLQPLPIGNIELYYSTPTDGSSTYFQVIFDDGFLVAHGNLFFHPMVLKRTEDYLLKLSDSLGQSIIRTDNGWLDTDEWTCLFWYKDQIISPEDIPTGSIPFSGPIQHQVYRLAESIEIGDHFFDYIFYVDEVGPGSVWTTSDGLHPITHHQRQAKMVLRKIKKALQD